MRKVEALLDRTLLPDGLRVLCAVSGGADSVCLLDLLRREGRGVTVACAHYNHRLRGEAADEDEAFVRELCRAWDIPFFAGSGDVAAWAAQEHLSLETAGRELRYAFLERCADDWGAQAIATAHTASDNAETVLLHLARGSGLAGLTGIPPRRGRIIRPLLSATRREVEDYLRRQGLAHREDESNALDDAARNRLRHGAVPALESVNGAFAESVGRTTRLLRADEDYLSAQAERAWEQLWDGEGLAIGPLLELPEALSFRVLRRFAGAGAQLRHIEALWALCRGENPSGELQLPGQTVRREYGRLRRGGGEAMPLPEMPVEPGAVLALPEYGWELSAELLPPGTEIQSSFNTFSFSYANICGKLSLTSRREGDRIRLRGRSGTRSVKQLMTDAKIPRRERGCIPVLRDGAGVLAVYGFGQAERACAQAGEAVFRIKIIQKAEG